MSFFSSSPQTYSLITCFFFPINFHLCLFLLPQFVSVPLLWPHFLSSLLQSICSQSRLQISRAPPDWSYRHEWNKLQPHHIRWKQSLPLPLWWHSFCFWRSCTRVFTRTHTYCTISLICTHTQTHTHTHTLLLMPSILIILTQIDTSTY